MEPNSTVTLVWLPYLVIDWPSIGPQSLRLGRAELLPDSGDVWTNRIGRPRPQFLHIFLDFPSLIKDAPVRYAYGSVIRSDDRLWLMRYVDEVVAVLYWLADRPEQSSPAERFNYVPIDVGVLSNDPAADVNLRFKHSFNIETSRSVQQMPPLAIRGFSQPCKLATESLGASELLRLLDEDPVDRRVVAVRHYFRTHFNNPFMGSSESDCAAHCAAIEASLNIDARSDGQKRFVAELVKRYGDDEGKRDFFSGLYVTRSLFVHGHLPAALAEQDNQHARVRASFENVRWRNRILKAISRDCISESLVTPERERRHEPRREATHQLDVALGSDRLWERLKKLFTQSRAADIIAAMSDDEFAEVRKLLGDLDLRFAWSCVRVPGVDKTVTQAIGTCILLIVRSDQASEATKAKADALGKAADALDRNGLREWCWANQSDWQFADSGSTDSRLSVYKRIAYALASWFDPNRTR